MLETPGEYTYLQHYVKGAEAYQNAFAAYIVAKQSGNDILPPDFKSVGERAIDDRTFQVTLTHPVAFFSRHFAPSRHFFPMHESSMRPFAHIDEKNWTDHLRF